MRSAFAVVILLATLNPAHALVMCAKRDRAGGGVALGSSVKLRDACRSTEAEVAPVSLGLQGPKGDQGDKGDTGEKGQTGIAGPRGPGLIVKDSNGALVGPVVDSPSVRDAVFRVATTINGQLIYALVERNGFSDFEGSFYARYASNDCTGQAFENTSGIRAANDGMAIDQARFHAAASTIYVPNGFARRASNSLASSGQTAATCIPNRPAGNVVRFIAPDLCCVYNPSSQTDVIDLVGVPVEDAGFARPFSVETVP